MRTPGPPGYGRLVWRHQWRVDERRRARPRAAFELQPQGRGALVVAAMGDDFPQKVARGVGLAAIDQILSGLEQLVGAALALGERRPRTVDVGARPRMRPVEEQHSRPDVNGVVVLVIEVAIQTLEEESLDLRLDVGVAGDVSGQGRFEAP